MVVKAGCGKGVVKLLFVCTGNICRSPTAERLAAAYAARAGIEGLSVSSAGTRAVIGYPIHPEAARVIKDLGGHTPGFAARQLTPRLATDPDLVIAMTRAHRDAVLELAPQKLHRTFTLAEAAMLISGLGARSIEDLAALRPHLPSDGVTDIADPIGETSEVFTAVGDRIAELVGSVMPILGNEARARPGRGPTPR